MTEKIIVTNETALRTKYGAGFSEIRHAMDTLIAADLDRGLSTRLIRLDQSQDMQVLGGPVVSNPTNPRQYKRAIDAAWKCHTPHYLMILGAPDVVPHQDLANPIESGDPDRVVWSDLPYACENGYSQDITKFIAPTRVMGRLPDITGGRDPSYLAGLLAVATGWKSRAPELYRACLGVTAQVWRKSTEQSLAAILSSIPDMQSSPPGGPDWGVRLKRRVHFFNCHGAIADPQFYGQRGNNFPEAHQASRVRGHLTKGTIAACECCYGAELYDPSGGGGEAGLCNAYLGGKAYGYFGSSTIAYGPAEGNDNADLICQYFMKNVIEGASLGRAALLARQDFIRQAGALDPLELKTAAQFMLLGDPSIQPVVASVPKSQFTMRVGKALPSMAPEVFAVDRTRRRDLMIRFGLALGATAGFAERMPDARIVPQIQNEMKKILKDAGVRSMQFSSFKVAGASAAPSMLFKAMVSPISAMYVALGRLASPTTSNIVRLVAVVARERAGSYEMKTLYSR